MNVAALAPVRKLTRTEYDRLVDMGWFQNERIELIDGILVAMSPQGSAHAETVTRLNRLLMRALSDCAVIRIQLPLGIGDDDEPEPDVAVVPLGDYSRGHPDSALLVIEVADSSLEKDRVVKGDLYARCGVPEYWLVDLEGRAVEIYRLPERGAYRSFTRTAEGGTVGPGAFPDVAFSVVDILPTA
jgi:Uma2 family endonuclease